MMMSSRCMSCFLLKCLVPNLRIKTCVPSCGVCHSPPGRSTVVCDQYTVYRFQNPPQYAVRFTPGAVVYGAVVHCHRPVVSVVRGGSDQRAGGMFEIEIDCERCVFSLDFSNSDRYRDTPQAADDEIVGEPMTRLRRPVRAFDAAAFSYRRFLCPRTSPHRWLAGTSFGLCLRAGVGGTRCTEDSRTLASGSEEQSRMIEPHNGAGPGWDPQGRRDGDGRSRAPGRGEEGHGGGSGYRCGTVGGRDRRVRCGTCATVVVQVCCECCGSPERSIARDDSWCVYVKAGGRDLCN
ncbi:hypothetical protein BC628DRAFT_91330 [Trametes gibbosa]|nr:hypothetical protein BC628DRAFT_91330 [Trametes gibbosa]